MSERDSLTEDERQEVERHLQRDPDADRGQLEDAIRRRRGRNRPAAEREKVRADLGDPEAMKARLQRLRDNPPPAPPEPPATSPATEIARAAWAGLQDDQGAPVPVPYVKGKDKLIVPRSVAHVGPDTERYYLARFGHAVHREPGGQLVLGFATEGHDGAPTLPANVWTMGLADAEKRGAVVPLALRIWVACILHVPLSGRRHGIRAVELDSLTLRGFLSWVYPGPARRPRPNEYWPRILKAREVINATELPFEYPSGSGNLWAWPAVTLAGPLTRPSLDDPWPVLVRLPPGDGTGPPVAWDRLLHWSTRDAACYRAIINLAYRWHIEGKRLMPVNRGQHWIQRRDPKLYDPITDADADAICYPPGTGAARRDQRIGDARAALEKLVRAGDAVAIEGRLLPPIPRDGTGT